MDKNKSLYKLKGLPRILYINLDAEPERAKCLEDQFKYWEVENYQRVSAYDGRGDRDLGEVLKGRYPDAMTSGEVGCVTSHLKALKTWLNDYPDESCLLMMEDFEAGIERYKLVWAAVDIARELAGQTSE